MGMAGKVFFSLEFYFAYYFLCLVKLMSKYQIISILQFNIPLDVRYTF